MAAPTPKPRPRKPKPASEPVSPPPSNATTTTTTTTTTAAAASPSSEHEQRQTTTTPTPATRSRPSTAQANVTAGQARRLHDVQVVHKMSVKECVCGVTLLNDELYVLCNGRVENQVEVHSSTDYTLLRSLTVPALRKNDAEDMAASQRDNSLYIADSGTNCIHRLLPDGSARRWKVPSEPCGLSVTPGGNLLVMCRGETNRLIELNVDEGSLVKVRQIELQKDIVRPCQAVQLTSGHFVVSQRGQSGLCEVDSAGNVTQIYDGADSAWLKCSCHVTIDTHDESMFVADQDNHRVVLLSRSLEFIGDVITLTLPNRMYFDHVTRRLYVGHGCDVTVVQL